MNHIKLLRPHQWIKNLFILLPCFAAGTINWPLASLGLCFLAFCLGSSAIYVVNDILDADKDRLHATKKFRPIAAKLISESVGWAMAAALAIGALGAAYFASRATLGFVACYMVLNVIYSAATKQIPIVDCASIALGFCLRFLAGGVGFSIAVNPHLLAACYMAAFSMALLKRRIELSLATQGAATRGSLQGLNLPTLDLLIGIFGATSLSLYAQWTLASGKPLTVFTLPFLSVMTARIVWLAYMNKKGEDFAKTLLNDNYALMATILFMGSIGFAVYS